jgi:1,4-dihydroxy-2-naphthoate octaprenyltransferase
VVLANAGRVDGPVLIGVLGPGFLFSALMMHNNARDVHKDALADKKTLPQVIGLNPTKVLYVVLVTGFYVVDALVAILLRDPWALLPMVTLPWAVSIMWAVARSRELGESMISWSRLYLVMIADFALFAIGVWV